MAGKSTVGELLAALKGTAFVDVDRGLERRTSRSLPDLLADGEEQFRELEEQVIRELLESGEYGVIAPGGGALTRPGTRALVRQQARVLFLDATAEVLWQRVEGFPGEIVG